MLHDIWQGSAMPPRVSLLVPALCQLFTSLSTVLPTTHAGAQELPGTRPKEELAVELMQARTYCRGVEIQLEKIRKKYPALKMQVLVAETSWKASPFFGGGKAIEKDMRAQAGKAADDFLKDIDRKGLELMKELGTDPQTALEADLFLASLEEQAKGKFPFPAVRGNLLWQHKPYQEKPEKEFQHGYVETRQHPQYPGLSVEIPMSWKQKTSPYKDAMDFSHCYGHGLLSFSLRVKPYPPIAGIEYTPQDAFDEMNREIAEEEYGTQGMILKTFTKTRLNGMPAVLTTFNQAKEQLGLKFVIEGEIIQVLAEDHIIMLMLFSPGPEASDAGVKRLQKNSPLFKMVAASLKVAGKKG